ncbi:MAG: cyclically-permuted mutarotase family protein [Bacteroides sp.]|nr:cyclically-permuted mutarotase family protein [Bacteroides sp.]MCM1378959.1 cyclically-permuted mutarotase family protein [Bacteroides sp.]MCM1445575.1 cyclically-permuted mutarotase family protein [Prevotella sp.]
MNRKLFSLLSLIFSLCFSFGLQAKTKVACIGNSITYGYLLPDREVNAYPFQLQRMLGDDYEVGNFGNSGSTLLRHGHKPYNKLQEFRDALAFKPDIAVIHLGVNDTDPRDWPHYNDEFIRDYLAIIDSLRAANPDVRILIAEITPIRAGHYRFKAGTRDWRLKIQDAIRTVAAISGAELIDFNSLYRDRQNIIFDNIHPNAEGATIMADAVLKAISGNYGGLQLPEVYQSGMVLQRNRPLTFRGQANAHARISLTLDNRTYTTRANNLGKWEITTAPIVTGPEYTLTVSDGDTTLTLTNILAGEVWLASGQSNMEFRLRNAVGGKETIAAGNDPQLRLYDMKECIRTDKVLWPDSLLDKIDRLEHYKPAQWLPATPENVENFSAIAYYFGKELRDSLGVPVGIISNAVGGSGTEAWIDVNTLEAEIPEILVNWRTNPYLQPWVQQRIKENIGDRPLGRHPYEPSYLFSAGIRPLAQFPLGGVIWYQGESNAQNIELHERLFPMLINSWRSEFNDPMLPFYYVQLSSMARPSWPEFRDSQRRMAGEIPGVGMAVSHDFGDSLDVHPRNKRPVANRLARLALNRTYGHPVPDAGPELLSALANADGTMTLTFSTPLATADGSAPRTFEVAEFNGYFFPAQAEISGNTITLKSMDVKNPRLVRYAWQPFTRANLVSTDGLPASTFKAEAENLADFAIEPGYERGVSAPFYGVLNGKLILAGGANFPCDDPLAADAQKKTYAGIYAADPDTLEWQRIGSLPEPMAYGASASTPDGLVFIAPNGQVYLLKNFKDLTKLKNLPPLNLNIDNAAAAAIGSTVYLAGGNVDGKPSNALYSIDLTSGKVKKLKSMPGNPRVQPVMAASGGKLYLWGGFAGKHDGKDATLNTDGLCYDPSANKWTALPAPSGDTSLGGGVAVTLPDGRIAVAGGVNKGVFLAALQNQAPDYLMHPIDWYRFNPNVMIFNPADGSWTIVANTPDAARAGAALYNVGNSLYLYGGELKPRIRTSETLQLKYE